MTIEPFDPKTAKDSDLDPGRHVIAAVLSLLPGLGHIFKGYYVLGALLLIVGIPVVAAVTALMSLATFGVSLLLPFVYIAMTAAHAYSLADQRSHPLHLI